MRLLYLLLLALIFSSCSSLPKGTGTSASIGTVSKGSLKNGRRFPYKGENFRYFSPMSFTFFNRAWVHSDVLDITLEAYQECQKTCPDRRFLLMECSRKKGGKMKPHRTHQNGTSIDFGSPLMKNGKPIKRDHKLGIFHYTMRFNENGVLKSNKNVQIDFETMGKHILSLEKAARKRGMYVKKVILKINLKDDLFKTTSGKIIKQNGIYFAQKLPKLIDNVHDDHYHVDFGYL